MRFESTKESEHARKKGLKTVWDCTSEPRWAGQG